MRDRLDALWFAAGFVAGVLVGVQGRAPASAAGASMGHGWPALAVVPVGATVAVGSASLPSPIADITIPAGPLLLGLSMQELPGLGDTPRPLDIIWPEGGNP